MHCLPFFRYPKVFPCLVLLILLTSRAVAQPKCKVEYYSTEQGLSHQAVTCMLKDREGFMWFGTWDGINRFDGNTFVSFKSSPGDNYQLGNDRIDQIVEDQSDHLWIKAYDRQIYRFDKKNEQFHPLAAVVNPNGKQKIGFNKILWAGNDRVWLQSDHEGLYCVPQSDLQPGRFINFKIPSNTIHFFHEDAGKNIWVGTPRGLYCLTTSASGYENNKITLPDVSAEAECTTFDEDAGCLYFSAGNGNLIIYNKSEKAFSTWKITGNRIQALIRSKKTNAVYAATTKGEIITCNLATCTSTTLSSSSGGPFLSLYEDKKGCLWIAPGKQGVVRFDPAIGSFEYFCQDNTDRLNKIYNRVSVLEDNNDLAWVFMKGGGFGYYDAQNKSFDYFLNTPDAGSNRLPGNIYSVYYDTAGVIWFYNSERQLGKILLQGNVFEQQLLVKQGAAKYDNEVRGILYDNKNRLWLGAKSGKVYVYQNGKRVTHIFDNEPAEGPGLVYTIMQDSRGNIWLGTKSNGLYKAVPVNKEETKYHLIHYLPQKNNIGNSSSLPCNEIYALLEDRQQRIWIGSFDKGLFSFRIDDGPIKCIQPARYPNETFHKIRHMALDDGGNIWIGTTNGLLLMNTVDPNYRYATYRKVPGDKNSLGNNDIQFIYRDSKNRMWLSTSGGGFCHASGNQPFASLQFRNYTTKDGMPNDYVLSCAEDVSGNLWLATENGLSKFNAENNTFRNYDSYDGLPGAGFSEAAACRRLSNGQLVFGTTKGYLAFDPARINKNRIEANIAFTNLQINNEDVQPETIAAAVLKSDINYTSAITLKYNQNIIGIDYAILDHRTGNRQAFAYRLTGFDSTWHNDRQQRRVTYTNLPPGHYVFEVKSVSSDLYSNAPYRRLAITIQPPPWKTWWAWVLYILFVATLLFFIRRTALAMIRLRHKIAVEQKLAALKLNFFTNVSHELRTPLTLIINPLEQLYRKEKLSAEGASYVDVARKNAHRLVRFINQLLDLRKVESGKATLHISLVEMVSFVKKISDYFTEAAASRRIKLDVVTKQNELNARVDAEKLDVVIYNLLANALKFTPEGKTIRILIDPVAEENSFLIAVHDQGAGVENHKLKDIFELFYEGDQSPVNQLKGSGIGLALSKELVNLHGGTISAANNDDGGLTVSVMLPLDADQNNKQKVAHTEPQQTVPLYETTVAQPLLPQQVSVPSLNKKHESLVLLVEDNDELRTFLKRQLSEFYRVEVAVNGEEGWQKAVGCTPDLIVSDIMMPVMDGIQMLDKLKNDVNTSHIPVVLLSARHSVESQIEGLKYGADRYITKPFHNDFLIASIDNLLRQRKKLFESLVEKKKPVELSPDHVVVTSKDETFLKEMIRIVEQKMEDPDFNIDSVAEAMNMGRTTFYRKFKSLTSLAPVEFVRDMRLQRAKQYLDAGGNNISEVAYLVGFSNPKYFSTCFKEKYHISPSDYLKAKLH